jgi:Mce-associated membrane protein
MTVEHPETEMPTDDLEAPPKITAVIRGWIHWGVAAWRPILVTALVVGALGLAGGMYFFRYGPDRQIGDAAVQQAVRAASDGTVAMLSYSPESLDRDFARAKLHLTGDLLAYYSKFTEQTVGPTARERQIAASAKVIRAAVSELRQDSAVVLVFVNQSTVTKEKPEPTATDSSFLVTMAKIDGSWLIAKFDRV